MTCFLAGAIMRLCFLYNCDDIFDRKLIFFLDKLTDILDSLLIIIMNFAVFHAIWWSLHVQTIQVIIVILELTRRVSNQQRRWAFFIYYLHLCELAVETDIPNLRLVYFNFFFLWYPWSFLAFESISGHFLSIH